MTRVQWHLDMEKCVLHFLKQNDWHLYPLCTLFGLSWRHDSLESKAPAYFWHCFGLRWQSVKRCFTELLVGLGLIKKSVSWACFRIHTVAITALFPFRTSPIAVCTCQGSFLAGACMDQRGGAGAKSVSFSAVLLLCRGSDNLLLPRRSHT